MSQIKIGRLDEQFFNDVSVKIENQTFKIIELCQIAPKTINTCVLNPYDSDNLNQVQKELMSLNMGLEIKKSEKMLILSLNP